MPRVSVIIPSFNTEKYIGFALDTVLSQSFQDFEVICVEDCSSDNTLKILEEYASKSDKIKLIRTDKHVGPGECRNIALRASDSEFISCVDSDDAVNKNILKYAVEKFEQTKVKSIWIKAKIYWEEEKKITPMFTFPKLQYLPEGFFELTPDNLSDFPAYSWNKFYRRDSIFNNIYWSKDYLFEDVEFYYRYYTQNPVIYVINKTLYMYRRHKKSIMSTSIVDTNYHKNLFYVTENIYNFLKENNLFDKYNKSLVQLMINNIREYESFDNIRSELVKTVNETISKINFPQEYANLKID